MVDAGGFALKLRRSTRVNGNSESLTDLAHSSVAKTTDVIRKHTYRNPFNRIQIDRCSATDRVVAGLEDHFASQAADCGRARGNHSSSKSRNRHVTRKDNDGSPAGFWSFAIA